jgi:hypothetical protein
LSQGDAPTFIESHLLMFDLFLDIAVPHQCLAAAQPVKTSLVSRETHALRRLDDIGKNAAWARVDFKLNDLLWTRAKPFPQHLRVGPGGVLHVGSYTAFKSNCDIG